MVSKNVDSLSEPTQSGLHSDVQSYMISKYREALKKGDKSAAKSCLLAARYFSVNDPNVTHEIYMMAKSDGDVSEAANSFTNIFNDLFNSNQSNESVDTKSTIEVTNQIKEEIRLLINDLRARYLKLNTSPNYGPGAMRPTHSVSQSRMLSPRLRLSSEDRAASRDTLAKLDSYLHSKTASIFYQQLFDNLTKDARYNILDHAINTCENELEKCRLMMMGISIFSDNVLKYGPRLIASLIDLSRPDKATQKNVLTSCPSTICNYARSLLILDAIPLVLSSPEFDSQDFEMTDLLHQTMAYYCEYCLEPLTSEYQVHELHEGLKKTIAARILGKDLSNSTSNDSLEETLISILNQLFERYLQTFDNETEVQANLQELRTLITDKSDEQQGLGKTTADRLIEIAKKFDFNGVPISSIEHPHKEKLQSSNENGKIATPPPKGRGRPKKAQSSVIVSPDCETSKRQYSLACQANFIFHSIVQHLLINCAKYLKQTKSRIVLEFGNPLANQIESELSTKTPNHRSSRSKHSNADTVGTGSSSNSTSAKRAKLDVSPVGKSLISMSYRKVLKESPLNSDYSKKMDQSIIFTLSEAQKCFHFLKHDTWSSSCIEPLWSAFIEGLPSFDWHNRTLVDGMIMTSQYQPASEILDKIVHEMDQDHSLVREANQDEGTSTLTITSGPPPVKVVHLRALTQLISCHLQLLRRAQTYECIDELLSKIKQTGLLANDDSHRTGNIIDEYMILVSLPERSQAEANTTGNQQQSQPSFGFLFFDALSMIRYAVNICSNILRRHMVSSNHATDLVVGHLIVLSQFDWPKESQVYEQSLVWLRSNKPKSTTPQSLSASTKFTYPDFFHYIFNPNIIEDFMAMLNQGFTLDIKSTNASGGLNVRTSSGSNASSSSGGQTSSASGERGAGSAGASSSTRSGKAITTRGVNKTFKEDLKVALIGQMKQSTLLMPLELVAKFVQSLVIPFHLKHSNK